MTRRTVAVAVHDGFYGCGTGAGYANRAFLEILAATLAEHVRLVVLPVYLAPHNPERQQSWYEQVSDRLKAEVYPVDNGTHGQDRWGKLANFRQLVQHTAEVLRDKVIPAADPLLVIAFDAPFLGLSALLPQCVNLVLVPRSSAMIHAPHDHERIEWERDGMLAGSRIGVISEYMSAHLHDDYGVPRSALVDLRDGLSSRESQPSSGLRVPEEFLLSFGRAEPYKGFGDLVEGLAILRDRSARVPHLVLGATAETETATPYQRELAARIGELGLSATLIERFGPEVRGLLTHPGVRGVVVPSRAEPFGRIPLEAFAAGAGPVVVTNTGGLAEQVTDGVTGFTAAPNNPAALAESIERALALSPAQRAHMRILARNHVTTKYDYDATVRRFLVNVAPWAVGYGGGSSGRRVGRVSTVPWVKAPIGLQTPHWNTIRPRRTVLVIVHNVTAATRLLDTISIFQGDPQVQVVFSWNGSDPFHHGLDDLLGKVGAIVIPWQQALHTEFDLAITANHGGLTEITAPIIVLSHGIGYTKYSPGNRKQETGNRKQETGNRKQETGRSSVFRRSGCSTMASPSRQPWCSPTTNSGTGSRPPCPRRCRPRSSPGIPATTASWPVAGCVNGTAEHWA